MIVSGIVTDEMPDVVKGYEAAGFPSRRGGDGGRVDRAAAELLSPDRAVEEGAALGQLACTLEDGGLLITASRLIEFGARAAILLAPGLFRLDLTPQEETLGLYPRVLGGWEVDGARGGIVGRLPRPSGPAPIELHGTFDGRFTAWIHVLSFTERDALATHFVAKADIRRSTATSCSA